MPTPIAASRIPGSGFTTLQPVTTRTVDGRRRQLGSVRSPLNRRRINHEPPTQPVSPALHTDALRSLVGIAVTTEPGLTGYVGGLTGGAVPS